MTRYTDDIVDDDGNVHEHYYGCAQELPDDDDRHKNWRKSRDENFGYDSTCLWGLDTSLAKMISAHINRFGSNTQHYPSIMTEDEWIDIVGKIEEGFRLYAELDDWDSSRVHNENMLAVNKAQELFHKHFFSLWV